VCVCPPPPQVVPPELVEFSRAALREALAVVARRPVYTLRFDRGAVATPTQGPRGGL